MRNRVALEAAVLLVAGALAPVAAGCSCPAGQAYRGFPGLGSCEAHACPGGSSPCVSRLVRDPPVPPDPEPQIVEVCGCGYGRKWDGSSCAPVCSDDESFVGPGTDAPPSCVGNAAPNPRREIAEGYSELPRHVRPWKEDSGSRGGPTCL